MTKRIEKQITINCTPYQVYNFISDPSNWTQITKISSVLKVDEALDSTYTLSQRTLLGSKSIKITLTKADPPKFFAYKNDSLVFTNESGFEITEHPEGTRVKAYIQADAGPLANTLALHGITKGAEKDLEEMLKKLKSVLGKIDPPKDNTQDPEIVSNLDEINTLLKKSPDTQVE